jgi:phosphoadenylyl-sulfate reductase (thioredoxin)
LECGISDSGENIYVVSDGVIYTPPQTAAILDGINRKSVIQIARDLGHEVVERDLARAELYMADEVFMAGTAVEITPVHSVAEQDAEYGPELYQRDPDLCCALRKVQPLTKALTAYDAWATGLRRAETSNRVIAPVVGWDARKGKVKVSPLARWTDDDVQRYVAEHGVLVNPLVYDGYPSIGCAPCTRCVAPGEDPRSGRWAGTAKTECGIHS